MNIRSFAQVFRRFNPENLNFKRFNLEMMNFRRFNPDEDEDEN
jgi:hypothetical protein